MKYKPDWEEARERLTALWEGRRMDRPCIAVTAPSGRSVPHPKLPVNPEDKWLSPEWVLENLRATLENTWWGGESIPSYLLMGGWTASLGGRPRFDHKTIWFETFEVDFSKPSPFVYSVGDRWRQKYEELYCAAVELAGRNDFLVGKPSLLPANDLLSMHMGTDAFLIALMDEPGWMRKAIIQGAQEQMAERNRLRDLIKDKHEFWYGNGGWMPFWAPEPYIPTQSDVSCMLSPDTFEEFVLPELEICGRAFGAMWYHLDGHDAKQHLSRLLSLPYMRVMQYVPTPSEPPNGTGQLELYRTIQKAGVVVHVAIAKQQVEPLIKALDPSLLMLDTRCESIDEGEELLAAAKGWT